MLNIVRGLALAWGRGVLELLFMFPILVLLTPMTRMEPIFIVWLAALTLYMPLGTITRRLLRIEMRFLLILLGALLVGTVSWLLFGTHYEAILAAGIGGLLFYHGFRTVRTSWYAIFPIGLYWISLFCYMMAALILSRLAMYASYVGSLSWLGAIALIITLIVANSGNLKEETHSGGKQVSLAHGVVLKNRLLIVLVLAVIVGIGFFGAIKRLVVHFIQIVFKSIVVLLTLAERLMSHKPAEEQQNQAAPDMGVAPSSEPSALALFLEKLMMYIVGALLVLLAIYLLFLLMRAAIQQVKRLLAWLRQRSDDEERRAVQDYEEEKTNLLDWHDIRKLMGQRLASLASRFQREPDWEKLNGSDRVRLLYRLFIKRSVVAGQAFQPHLTPQEQLAKGQDRQLDDSQRAELTDAYNAARYGSKSVDEALTNKLKRDSGL